MIATKYYPACVFLFLCLLEKAVAVTGSQVQDAPIVDLGYASYQGSLNATSNITHFLGMRYAASPTGALRWHAPQTPTEIVGIQQADTQPPMCLQAATGGAPTNPMSQKRSVGVAASTPTEDCLFLNVWVPGALPVSETLPVVVFIHGGGYASGSATGFDVTDTYDGQDLIRESNNGVVVVVIQYRLGLFGFLPGTKVKEGGALNVGLLDQDFALRWVQNHIQKFGSDPTKVTIWGQSAGAGSVIQHVVAQGGKTRPPLFRSAITSSTFLPSQYHYNDRIPETLYNEAVSQTNCTDAPDTLSCLRSTPASILETVSNSIAANAFFGTYAWVPVVDGTFITQSPLLSFRQGKVNGEHLYSITNAFEGALFIDASSPLTVPEFLANLFPLFEPSEISAAVKQYEGLGTTLFQVTAIMGEAIFICPTYAMLRAFPGRSFKAEFAIPPGGHGNDLVYYYTSQVDGSPPYNNTVFDTAFSEAPMDFVMSLSPGIKWDPTNVTPKWSPWTEDYTEMLFNETEAGAPVVEPIRTSEALMERCNFWESVATLSAQ